jgi:hypothetical protein
LPVPLLGLALYDNIPKSPRYGIRQRAQCSVDALPQTSAFTILAEFTGPSEELRRLSCRVVSSAYSVRITFAQP